MFLSAARLIVVFGVLAALPTLSACDTADEAVMSVQDEAQAPPQAPIEAIPVIADPQREIWIPGYWAPSGHDFYWVSGKVVARPSPTAVWASARWAHHVFGWSFVQGHWE
jgi:hypothetical protein